jgi:uncharacterized membrane protein YvbJ
MEYTSHRECFKCGPLAPCVICGKFGETEVKITCTKCGTVTDSTRQLAPKQTNLIFGDDRSWLRQDTRDTAVAVSS